MIRAALATFAALAATTAPLQAQAQTGNPREVFGSVDNRAIVRLPIEGECWIVGGRSETLFGLSIDRSSQMGMLIVVRDQIPVNEVSVSVGLHQGFQAARSFWRLNFRNRGTTNRRDYVYQADITNSQLSELLDNAFITFLGDYRTERGAGRISFADTIDFSQAALVELRRCVASLH